MDNPVQNKPASQFDAYVQSYSDTVNSAIGFTGLKVDYFTRVKAAYFVELVESALRTTAQADVLDIGCGVANSHAFFSRKFKRLAGIDISSACIARAAQINPQNEYKTYNGLDVPYGGASFDAALAVCVFHHVPVSDRLALARDARRVLRPGGIFVIFEHNPRNPLTMRAVSNCEFDQSAVLLDRNETERLLREAGFSNVKTRFILNIPAGYRWLRKIDGLFSGLAMGAQYYTFGQSDGT